MNNKIGLIGASGRMGQLVDREIERSDGEFILYQTWDRSCGISLEEIYHNSDFIVDFSHHSIIMDLLNAGIKYPKPTLICTTGWHNEKNEILLKQAATKFPIVVAPNTSAGAYLQSQIVKKISSLLKDYDIDIIEKHHRHKKDNISGTSLALIKEIQEVCPDHQILEKHDGARGDNMIGLNVVRSGNIFGEHEVIFTSFSEMLSIKHIALDRQIFAQGALKIIRWLRDNKPNPGVYDMHDIFNC